MLLMPVEVLAERLPLRLESPRQLIPHVREELLEVRLADSFRCVEHIDGLSSCRLAQFLLLPYRVPAFGPNRMMGLRASQ